MSTDLSFSTEHRSAWSNDPIQLDPRECAFQVSNLYDRLYTAFGLALTSLRGNPRASGSVVLELAHEEFTRLKIWGIQCRVSLSDAHELLALEEQPTIAKLLVDVLKEANGCLLKIVPRASTCDAASLEFIDDSDDDSALSFPGDEETTLVNVASLFKMVFENIDELYRLKTLLQKPRLKGRYLHSSRPYRDLPGYHQDYEHVRQKLDRWKVGYDEDSDKREAVEEARTPRGTGEMFDQLGISMEEIEQRRRAEDESLQEKDILCRRLAAANSKRRKQLQYWEAHPYRQTGIDQVPVLDQGDSKKPAWNEEGAERCDSGRERIPASSIKAPTTVHTFSTAPRSAILPAGPASRNPGMTRTTYEPSVVEGTGVTAIRVPDAPTALDGETTVECPYCHMHLGVVDVEQRVDWKRHVFRDLRPYVCTVGSCSDPDRQFVTRHDWIYHEVQAHHRQWDCNECDEAFESRSAFCLHTSDAHRDRWNSHQTSILSELRERAKDDTAWFSCKLCSANYQKQSYFRHVANHLEEISLFALPNHTSAEEDEANSVDDKAEEEANSHFSDAMSSDLVGWKSTEKASTEGTVDPKQPEMLTNPAPMFKSIPCTTDVLSLIHRRRNKTGLPEDLQDIPDILERRGQIFLIDDSSSMAFFPDQVHQVVEGLASVVKSVDPDGMELRFTSKPRTPYKGKHVTDLLRHITSHRPPKNECLMEAALDILIDSLVPSQEKGSGLRSMINRATRSVSKTGISVYILTDGIWSDDGRGANAHGPLALFGVDELVTRVVQRLRNTRKHRSYLSLQFIRFGHHPAGKARLRYLANEMKNVVDWDIVDQRRWDGPVRPMLLGALIEFKDLESDDRDD